MLYNVVWVSAIQQHESATGKHMSPLSGTSLPPSRLSEHLLELSVIQLPTGYLFYTS